MKLFWMWVTTIVLLAGTVYAQGGPGVVLGSMAGVSLGLSVCITAATARRKA